MIGDVRVALRNRTEAQCFVHYFAADIRYTMFKHLVTTELDGGYVEWEASSEVIG
jgi:hypothetical protein